MPTKSQWIGIATILLIVLVFLSVILTHRVPEHETYAWRQDSIAAARDSIRHYYDSINHRQDSLRLHYDSIRVVHDSLREHWANYYDSVYAEKARRKQLYDSIHALPREARKHYYDSLYQRTDSVGGHISRPDSTHIFVFRGDSAFLGDSLLYVRAIKKDTIIELNSADTTCLMYIRGVGRYTARKIIARRTSLGGFYSAQQLREISIADSIIAHFVAEPDSIRPIRVNHAGVETLVRHPYIDIEPARALYEHRRRRGNWRSLSDIEYSGIFTPEAWSRVKYYLTID